MQWNHFSISRLRLEPFIPLICPDLYLNLILRSQPNETKVSCVYVDI